MTCRALTRAAPRPRPPRRSAASADAAPAGRRPAPPSRRRRRAPLRIIRACGGGRRGRSATKEAFERAPSSRRHGSAAAFCRTTDLHRSDASQGSLNQGRALSRDRLRTRAGMRRSRRQGFARAGALPRTTAAERGAVLGRDGLCSMACVTIFFRLVARWRRRAPRVGRERCRPHASVFRSRDAVKGVPSARRCRRASPLNSFSASEDLVSMRSTPRRVGGGRQDRLRWRRRLSVLSKAPPKFPTEISVRNSTDLDRYLPVAPTCRSSSNSRSAIHRRQTGAEAPPRFMVSGWGSFGSLPD